MNIAVYGTLKRGLSNHYLLKSSKFLGVGHTKENFVMFSTGGFPVIFHGGHAPVSVECFDVNATTLSQLDELEWNGHMFVRTLHTVLVGSHKSGLECSIYLGVPKFWEERLPGLIEWAPHDGVLVWHPRMGHNRSLAWAKKRQRP